MKTDDFHCVYNVKQDNEYEIIGRFSRFGIICFLLSIYFPSCQIIYVINQKFVCVYLFPSLTKCNIGGLKPPASMYATIIYLSCQMECFLFLLWQLFQTFYIYSLKK